MTKPILYFAHWCPDTEPFVAELARLGVEFDECDITKGGSTLKPFLYLRDHHPAFANAKANGYIGIPALLLGDNQIVLDLDQLRDVFSK